MTAKDVLSSRANQNPLLPIKNVDSNMPLFEVLPLLLDAPGRLLGVTKSGEIIGHIDETSLLEGLGRMIMPRDDSSTLTLECKPEQYSASVIAHAVEDADAHLVDLISRGTEDGRLRITLRVRALDSEGAVRSLERYGYEVIETSAEGGSADQSILAERLASLRTLLNV